MSTPNIGLPYLASSQANKEITHNEALIILDAIVQSRVLDKDLTAPPGSPADGDCYIVAATATGAWAGHEKQIAVWFAEAAEWTFIAPHSGWRVFVVDEALFYTYSGTAWSNAYGYSAASAADGIVASATQTQAGATVLTTQCSRLGTVATIGNSVKIGVAATVGMYIELLNAGANAAWVWPATGDAIDAAAANARDANALAAAGTRRYRCFTAGVWRTLG